MVMKRRAALGQCRIARVPYHPKVTRMLAGVLQLRSWKPDHLKFLSEGIPYSRNQGTLLLSLREHPRTLHPLPRQLSPSFFT